MDLFPKDYTEFTLERKPGYLYINYPHVGKHFAEIVFSNDFMVKKEQWHPQSICRTGFNVWLGPEVDGSDFKAKAKKFHFELKDRLEEISDFSSENIEVEFKKYLEENELGMGRLLPAFRVSLTGLGMGPSLFEIASLLGKSEAIKRMETALNTII